MKRFLFHIVFISLVIYSGILSAQCHYAIIPYPENIIPQSGVFTINENTEIIIQTSKEDYHRIIKFLHERLNTVAGFSLTISKKKSPVGTNSIFFREVAGFAPEAYRLIIDKKSVIVESSYANGAFYALQTIFQLLPAEIYSNRKQGQIKWTLPCVEINDTPRFSYRGMHLDVCSHFFPVEYIKRYLDLMAMHKQNVFHWHLTEDQGWRIEIKKYPELTNKGSIRKETVIGTLASKVYDGTPYGGYYTQEEIRDVVRYAADRFITVIPEIEMPGHALAAISCFPHLSCGLEGKYEVATRWGVFKQVYCPKEETFQFLEDVLTEVMDLFPSKLIHIGGDECPKDSWRKCPNCQNLITTLGLEDEFALQSYFIQRIEKFLNSKGRQIIGWDEILQGGLAPNATVMSWLGEEGGIKSAQQQHNAIMCPHQKYYLDYYQFNPEAEQLCMGHLVPLREVYDYNPVPDVLNAEEQKYIQGVQGCVWTEYMKNPERVEYMAFPRVLAISETGWTPAPNKNWDSFTQRLETHFKRLDQLNVNYSKRFYDVLILVHKDGPYSKVITMSVDAPDAEIHYTLDGTTPTMNSPIYKTPLVINKQQIIKATAIRDSNPIGKTTYMTFD